MTDYPVIFSAPMVLALLAGRKTQTRRLAWSASEKAIASGAKKRPSSWQKVAAGDRLYVREAITRSGGLIQYMADHKTSNHLWPASWQRDTAPGMHLLRAASRLTLIVEATKVEPLQNIAAEDAKAEGVEGWSGDWFETGFGCIPSTNVPARTQFAGLWKQLHGPDAWEANPDVVALTFRVVKENIDRIKEAA